ncbi:eukaryotic translation initiation factor 3 subunit F-like [Varroa jacobsoni]|uniref:Eukaryotic translation initiation factor 3 subunit F n=1 Tax=Varroa destructor TaxID=109461 RepID=A0A7M7K7T0_VARDE|nr:eukaryotic translation initiation factor 3 subunit F-like [Varroa destructor]XP_022698785.1 eukaryotic translation initiation factor 3 subunit F-like [Varroa jacobsoni]
MPKITTVRLHPTALFTIVDSYEHRSENQQRVIGTLLGSFDFAKGAVDITNCFHVNHSESGDEVGLDLEYAKTTTELHRRVNPTEQVVGWFATGAEIPNTSVLIHQYYSSLTKHTPVHVTVDTSMEGSDSRMGIKAYVGVNFGVPRHTVGTMFPPCKVEIVGYQEETVSLRACQRTREVPEGSTTGVELPTDLDTVIEACVDMRQMLKIVIDYVDNVLANRIPADNTVGRRLMDMVHSVPKMDNERFQEVLNGDMKDLLMVAYLTMITKTQLCINEKLCLM